jgi:hypothetical protein
VAGDPVYELEVDETAADLADVGGVGNINNPANPFKNYTQVFVPYCSGDLHWGSKDVSYTYTPPVGPDVTWPIRHRGFDNLMAVLEWLTDYYQSMGFAPDKVVLAGGSAGGYGGLLALPAVKEILPRRTRTFLLADSANGVITDDFYGRALGGYAVSGGVWGAEQNIPDFLQGAFASGADNLAVATYTTLAWRFPWTRIGQYTRAWDKVQVFYYNVAGNINNPERWGDPDYLLPAALEWTLKARLYMRISSLAPNYRLYIAAGSDHTVLADDSFYTEQSGAGVLFTDWVGDMINRRFVRRSDWQNVSCAPFCLQPGDLTP